VKKNQSMLPVSAVAHQVLEKIPDNPRLVAFHNCVDA
jgi:hypothetical protein